ncbi:MAG: lysophospholipid acyltransferase family protein [Roseiflexaceae bacterium]
MRHWLAKMVLRLFGWRAEGSLADHPKCVVIVAPHTSNWDFLVMLLIAVALRLKVTWMGKHTLFRWPFGGIMRRLGGLPINRGARHNMVQQAVNSFRAHERLALAILPEGTRKRTPYWRSGFYHIGLGAQVPIALGFADYHRKVGGIGRVITPSGDVDADMALIRDFYSGIIGKRPEQFGEIRLKTQDEDTTTVERTSAAAD